MIHATTDEPTEVVNDTVYQVQKPDGSFVPKYVKVTKTYGDELSPDDVEAEVVLDRDEPSRVGKKISIAKSMLRVPDTYPGVMFKPDVWVTKANQTQEQIIAEASAFVDAWLKVEGVTAAAENGLMTGEVDRVMDAVRIALTGFFGGFTLVAILHWLRGKVDASLAARGGNVHVMPFERKLGTMKRELNERQQNLNTPVQDRGEFNAKHPFGAPRAVQQFHRPELAG